MENTQLNWCIRLSFEIILVIVCLAPAQDTPTNGMIDPMPPIQESPGKRPGNGRNLATLNVTVEPDQISFQNQNRTLADLTRLNGESGPDQIVIKLHGSTWKSFFNWAVQNDKPICIVAEE